MEYEDRIAIPTPEGIELELTLAGLGSRFTSALVDLVIQLALLGALTVVFVVSGIAGAAGWAAFFLLSFLLFAGYDVLFEVLASGRTPGKRLNGLRVVRSEGAPVGFLTSTVRNVLRLVDILPGSYLVGMVAILVTRRNQRLGDLAADTVVIRERRPAESAASERPGVRPDATVWDTSAVSRDELAAVRRFLARRAELTPGARGRLGGELASALRAKVPGAAGRLGDEEFLEAVTRARASRE